MGREKGDEWPEPVKAAPPQLCEGRDLSIPRVGSIPGPAFSMEGGLE